MIKFLNIILDEYKAFIKDYGAMLIMIVGVVSYSVFYAIPYAHEVVKEVPIGVLDNDNTVLSREFIRELNISDMLKIVSTPKSIQEAETEFFNGQIKGYVVIPKKFERDILRGQQSVISLFADSSYMIIYKSVYSGVVSVATELGAKIEIGKLMKSGVPKQMAIALKQPFNFVATSMYNPAGGYATYVFPVVIILILHQTLLVGIGLMLGTKNEFKETYCEKGDVAITIFGRSTAYVLLYLFYSLFYFMLYPQVIVYPMSYNIVPLFMILIPMFYSVAMLAHAISFIFKTRESSLLILVVTSLVFIFLPGLIWPRESIPQIINIIAMFLPATCGIDGIIKVNQMNATLWDVKFDILWLVFLCFLYYLLAMYVINKIREKHSINKDIHN